MQRHVVITGCGLVTAAGNDLDGFWATIMRGASFIRPLQQFACPEMDTLMGAAVELPSSDDLPTTVDSIAYRSRCTQLAIAAAGRAVSDAALASGAIGLERAGIVFGTTLGQERQVADLSEHWVREGPDSVDSGFLRRCDNHGLAAVIAARHGLGGPVLLSATACSSGNASVAMAYDLVSSGSAEAMIAGGADTFSRLIYCGFRRMGALAKDVCRPFDRRRDGVSFGEGAAFLVLEEQEAARQRGARIYAELAGYGISNDAYHMTAPDPNGDGVARAMRQALETTSTTMVDYVSAHGTGTPYNDVGEARAMKAVFGDRVRNIPISSIKSTIGHTNGAAGAIESIVCALALVHQAVPPTANFSEPDPDCDLDCVPGEGRPMRVDTCLNLAAGFGGSNVCLVIKRPQ